MIKDIKKLSKVLYEINFILTRKQKIHSMAIIILIIICSLLETLGVGVVLVFSQAVLSPQKLWNNKYFNPIFILLHIENDGQIIVFASICIILIYIVKNLILALSSYVQIRFRWKMQRNLSIRMLHSYMLRPYEYYLGVNSSQVLNGITNDINSLYSVIESFFLGISYVFTILMIGVVLIISDYKMALAVLAISGLCFIMITFVFRKKLSGVGQKQRRANTEQTKVAYQAIMGIKEIDVTQRRDYFISQYSASYEEAEKANVQFNFLSALPSKIIEAICISGIIIIICIRCLSGTADLMFISKMSVFVVAAFRILPLTANLVGIANRLVYYWAGVDATYNNVIETQNYESTQNKREHCELVSNVCLGNGDGGVLSLERISWKYPNSKSSVLNNLSLEIHPNESVGIIGASGAGKTTVSDIILGLYKPQKGTVKYDNIDIFSMPTEWSRLIGYVPQSIFLIDDSIRANVTFGIDRREIDDDLVWNALNQAQLAEFVRNMPEGIDTVVGERGVKLSGGQRQRIAIARALYYNPKILVLDEATSALDNDTEKAVMQSIDNLHGEKTLIIIAHRLSTIMKCDTIYEIKDGEAVKISKSDLPTV